MEASKDIPEMLHPDFTMNKPNDDIVIHDGIFYLKTSHEEIEVTGSVKFTWLPKPRLRITAFIKRTPHVLIRPHDTSALIGNHRLGTITIQETNYTGDEIIIYGYIYDGVVTENAYDVDVIKFNITNLCSLPGDEVKTTIDGEEVILPNYRTTLINERFTLILEKELNFHDKEKALKKQGGYLILYNCELRYTKKVKHEVVTRDLYCLHHFINLINGTACGLVLRHGYSSEIINWKDYKGYAGYEYNFDPGAFPLYKSYPINALWEQYYRRWHSKEERPFLESLSDWHTEVHSLTGSGHFETQIIIIQAALELVFNWLVIEQLRMLEDDERTKLTAANKIRILIHLCNVKREVPANYPNFKKFCEQIKSKDTKEADAPEGFVAIRNALVHSQKNKLATVSTLSMQTKLEAVQVGLWYLELGTLRLLKYKGLYNNRANEQNWTVYEVLVPWMTDEGKE